MILRLPRVFILLLVFLFAGPSKAQEGRSPELNAQFHRAETAFRSGTSLLEAKARVDRVIQKLPDDGPARKLRAEVLLALARPQEALVDARQAVSLMPTDGEAHVILCEAARLSDERQLSEKAMDDAAACLNEDPALHVRLSWNALELGLLDRAEAFARIALALNNRDASAYYQLSRVFTLQEKPDLAVQNLVRGFKASLLDPVVVERDPILEKLTANPDLRPYLRP